MDMYLRRYEAMLLVMEQRYSSEVETKKMAARIDNGSWQPRSETEAQSDP